MSRQYTLQRTQSAFTGAIDYAAELNEQQFAAVTAPPGPLLVIAGAGTGKTRTLTYRVAYLLENGIDPRNILLAHVHEQSRAPDARSRGESSAGRRERDFGAERFTRSEIGCCAGTAARSVIRADSPSWIAKIKRI